MIVLFQLKVIAHDSQNVIFSELLVGMPLVVEHCKVPEAGRGRDLTDGY